MQVGMTGGDLEGGRDGARNAEVDRLKQLFYKDDGYEGEEGRTTTAAAATATVAARDRVDLGLLRDVPIARFRFVLMPHQQAAFNIFQPQLVHMFETLLATPPPWLYVHALLPGGADNLGNPEYALPGLGKGEGRAAGAEATLQGVLVQVATAKRMPDARIVLTCQALGRAVVLRGTQVRPYSSPTPHSTPRSNPPTRNPSPSPSSSPSPPHEHTHRPRPVPGAALHACRCTAATRCGAAARRRAHRRAMAARRR